jgi:hypothetical protein
MHLSRAECSARPIITQTPAPTDKENDPPLDQYWTLDPVPGQPNHWIITLQANPNPFPCANLCPTSFLIERDPDAPDAPNEVVIIDSITITRPAVFYHSISVVLGSDAATGRLRGVENISVNPWAASSGEGYVTVTGYLDGASGVSALGAITGVNRLAITTQAGDVGGPITCSMHPGAEPSNAADAHASTIELQSVAGGSLTGNVTMEPSPGTTPVPGDIMRLEFQAGTVGTAQNPIEIRSDRSICNVVGSQIHAFLGGTDTGNSDSFVEYIGRVHTESSNNTGVFTGEIRAERMAFGPFPYTNPEMTFQGEMSGHIWLQEFEEGGSSNVISIPALMLTGTIAFSVPSPGGGIGVGDGPVKLLAGPSNNPPAITMTGTTDGNGYSRPASSIGGGAVCILPVRAHLEDSFPIHNSTITDMNARPGPGLPIRARHLGLVNIDTTSGQTPFIVERRRIGSTSELDWQDQTALSGGCFADQSVDSTNATIVNIKPEITLQRGFEYRVRPRVVNSHTVLKSDVPHLDAANDPDVSTQTPLTFEICDGPGEGDADDNGCVNFADITEVLSLFGLTHCLKTGDADRDGDVDFADITAVQANFLATPCGSCATGLLLSGGDGFATMDLDGDLSAASAGALVSDALTTMGYASIEAFVDAIAAMDEESRNAEVRRLGRLLEGAE